MASDRCATSGLTPDFDAAVERLGGYRLGDEAMEPIRDGLYRKPWEFNNIENDWVQKIRYCQANRKPSCADRIVSNRKKTMM
jgi:hypothetical protein